MQAFKVTAGYALFDDDDASIDFSGSEFNETPTFLNSSKHIDSVKSPEIIAPEIKRTSVNEGDAKVSSNCEIQNNSEPKTSPNVVNNLSQRIQSKPLFTSRFSGFNVQNRNKGFLFKKKPIIEENQSKIVKKNHLLKMNSTNDDQIIHTNDEKTIEFDIDKGKPTITTSEAEDKEMEEV